MKKKVVLGGVGRGLWKVAMRANSKLPSLPSNEVGALLQSGITIFSHIHATFPHKSAF